METTKAKTASEGRILTELHVRYLGDIPLAHVAVKLEGVFEHCDEREGACQDGNNVLQATTRQRGKE